ncbi:hypothetical protein [Chryseobacterium flavum]|uniref:hypothetical protein n=1 Tax=Chryseobacterium flavum TaxID=415851 RepID=UPI0028ADF72D|nr:hypothetical protein [Chryseobacterium flavum]
MKKKNQSEKKLSLKKLQMVKIANPNKIFGGSLQHINDCTNPDNGSNNQSGIDTGR